MQMGADAGRHPAALRKRADKGQLHHFMTIVNPDKPARRPRMLSQAFRHDDREHNYAGLIRAALSGAS